MNSMAENVIIELKDWREVYTTQKPMLENAKENNHKFYFTTDNGKSNGKMFGSCPDIDTFLSYYSGLESKDKHFYEFLHGDSPINEYYDIDLKADKNITTFKNPENIFMRFNSIRNEFINEYFPNSDILTDWRITDSSKLDKELGVWKVSLHLVNRLNVFENNKITKKWYELFETFLNQFYVGEEIFDNAVSSIYRSMRMIQSTKIKDTTRPLLCAQWHSASVDAAIKEFFIQNSDSSKRHACIRAIEEYSDNQKLIKSEEKKLEKNLVKFETTQPPTKILDEEDDEVELLITLIANQINAKTHSLCDNSTDKITYKSFMNLCFAYLSTQVVKGELPNQKDVEDFISTELYPLYRNSKEHAIEPILSSIIKSATRNGANKSLSRSAGSEGVYTKASLHFWAREDFGQYKAYFGKAKIVSKCGVFNDDPTYFWGDFVDYILGHRFDDYSLLLDYVRRNFNRVCVIVKKAKSQVYYMKIEYAKVDCKTYVLEETTEKPNYMCKYVDKKGNQTCKLRTVLDEVIEDLKTYNALAFTPFGKELPENHLKIFNTFSGMKAQLIDTPQPETLCPKILNHIKLVLCDNKQDRYDYLITWLAHICQYPEIKTRVMMILYSADTQVGKGLIAEALVSKIFGFANATKTGSMNDAIGDFNGLISNKILVVFDEANNGGNDKITESKVQSLKSRITDSIQSQNKKGINQEQVIDYCNFMALLNGNLKIENNDGRTCVFKVSDSKKGDTEYFKTVLSEMNDETATNALYTYLFNYKIVLDLTNIPKTEERKEMIMQTAEQPIKFFNEIKEGNYILNGRALDRKLEDTMDYSSVGTNVIEKVYITLDILYSEFNYWVVDAGEKSGVYSKIKFAKFCKLSFGDCVRRRTISGNKRYLDITSILPIIPIGCEEITDDYVNPDINLVL